MTVLEENMMEEENMLSTVLEITSIASSGFFVHPVDHQPQQHGQFASFKSAVVKSFRPFNHLLLLFTV